MSCKMPRLLPRDWLISIYDVLSDVPVARVQTYFMHCQFELEHEKIEEVESENEREKRTAKANIERVAEENRALKATLIDGVRGVPPEAIEAHFEHPDVEHIVDTIIDNDMRIADERKFIAEIDADIAKTAETKSTVAYQLRQIRKGTDKNTLARLLEKHMESKEKRGAAAAPVPLEHTNGYIAAHAEQKDAKRASANAAVATAAAAAPALAARDQMKADLIASITTGLTAAPAPARAAPGGRVNWTRAAAPVAQGDAGYY